MDLLILGSYSDASWCIIDLHQSLEQNGVIGGIDKKDIPADLLSLAKQVEDGRKMLSQVDQLNTFERRQPIIELPCKTYFGLVCCQL